MFRRLILFALAVCIPQQLAAADWLRAESPHFVIHAKLDEPEVRALVQRMEDFDRLMRSQLPFQTQPGRKLHIYLDRQTNRISYVAKRQNLSTTRIWPEMAGSFAQFDPSDDEQYRFFPIFYAHAGNYLQNSFYRPNPAWLKAGLPTFFATAYVTEDGDFILGVPDLRRPLEKNITQSRLSDMLNVKTSPKGQSAYVDFFRLSSSVVYPLLTDSRYDGVLEKFLNAYSKGVSLPEANTAFGDLGILSKEIREIREGKPTLRKIRLNPSPAVKVAVRPMEDDEIALVDLRFARLLDKRPDSTIKKLKRLTERFPQSADAWYELASAEFARAQSNLSEGERTFRGFGFADEIVVTAKSYSDEEAWRAVKLALSLRPDFAQAKRLKAEIMLSRLSRSNEIDIADGYENVRSLLAPLALEPERNPFAAALYYETFLEQRADPTETAFAQLAKAFQANPGVEEFRYAYAVALAKRGNGNQARILLSSMLNDPEFEAAARRALDQVPS